MRTGVTINELSIVFLANDMEVKITATESNANGREYEISCERFASGVLPYQAKFNAEYCIDNMPDTVYEYIVDAGALKYFKNWLTLQYEIAVRNYALGGLGNEKYLN